MTHNCGDGHGRGHRRWGWWRRWINGGGGDKEKECEIVEREMKSDCGERESILGAFPLLGYFGKNKC